MLMNEIDITGRIIKVFPYGTLLLIAYAGFSEYMEENSIKLRASGRYIPNIVRCCEYQYHYSKKASLKVQTERNWIDAGQVVAVYVREDRTKPISDEELRKALNVFAGNQQQELSNSVQDLNAAFERFMDAYNKRKETKE